MSFRAMLQEEREGILVYGYGVAALLLASLPATLGLTWLIPGVVVLEAALWVLLAVPTILELRKGRPLGSLVSNLRRNWTIVPFTAFAGLSIAWSVDRQASISRWLVLLSTIVAGGYIGLHCTTRRILRILAAYLVVVMLFSTIFVFVIPPLGVMNYHDIQGAWRGIFWHKNHMGIMAAFATVIFLTEALAARRAVGRASWGWAVLYVLSVAFLSQTDSVGSYLTVIIVHGLILMSLAYLALRRRLRQIHYMLVGVATVLALVVVFANLGRVFGAFNRRTNLTGRVPMWGHLFEVYISQRPVAGYGFNAFWYVEAHRTTMQALAGYPDPIVIADNGFIDILANSGAVGLALFLACYMHFWWRSLAWAHRANSLYGVFPLIVAAFTLLANMTWSLLFENESVLMLTMLALMFSMSSHPEAAIADPSRQGSRAKIETAGV